MTKLFEEGLPASPTEAEARLSEKDRLVAAIQHELMTLKSELERANDQPATRGAIATVKDLLEQATARLEALEVANSNMNNRYADLEKTLSDLSAQLASS